MIFAENAARRSGEAAPLPISAAALGRIYFDGKPRTLDERLEERNGFLLIDGIACFKRIACRSKDGSCISVWMRAPRFMPLLEAPPAGLPLIYQVNEEAALHGFPLHALYDPANGRVLNVSLTSSDACWKVPAGCTDEVEQAEKLISEGRLAEAFRCLAELPGEAARHPRVLFAQGALSYRSRNFVLAKRCFHAASLYGHPDAFDAEVKATAAIGSHFRLQNPGIFQCITEHRFADAARQLRALLPQYPQDANAVLAYCLRREGLYAEGIKACTSALECDLRQPDVLGHLWACRTSCKLDNEALQSARLHLQLYPLNPAAFTDALDSSVLLGDKLRARWFALGYLVQAVNLYTALQNLFKYHELCRDWETLNRYYEAVLPALRAPTPQVLTEYGEALVETGRFGEALEALDRAMRAAPDSPETVLAYGRALAKSGDPHAAIRLISSAIGDGGRRDVEPQRMLMITFLSELLRNTGNLQEALELWERAGAPEPRRAPIFGVRPLVEYTYCLAASQRYTRALMLTRFLKAEAPEQYVVQELEEKLRAVGFEI